MTCNRCHWGKLTEIAGVFDCTYNPQVVRKSGSDSCSFWKHTMKCKNCFCGRVDKETMSNPFALAGREFVSCPKCGGTGIDINA